MAEGEVTSWQDGGAHMWTKAEVDATAAAGGMTRSVVRRSYFFFLKNCKNSAFVRLSADTLSHPPASSSRFVTNRLLATAALYADRRYRNELGLCLPPNRHHIRCRAVLRVRKNRSRNLN
jgi:hypothetical protein